MNEQKNGSALMKREGDAPAETPTPRTEIIKAEFGDVFIKRDSSGRVLRPIKAEMMLFEKERQIYKISKDVFGISGDGYAKMNKVASITITTPPFVIVDGIKKPNPYIERNPKTRLIESVFVRKIGFGYSPVGNIVAIDKTLYYHVYSYFIQSVQAKMKRVVWENGGPTDKREFPNAARTGTKDDKPTDVQGAKWAFFPTVEPLGIWINYADPVIDAVLDEFTQRQRFGDRIAQSIVERNILKAHPAIGISSGKVVVDQNRGAYMNVAAYGFRTDESPEQMKAAVEKGEAIIEAETIIDVKPEDEKPAMAETLETEHAAETDDAAKAGDLFKVGKK